MTSIRGGERWRERQECPDDDASPHCLVFCCSISFCLVSFSLPAVLVVMGHDARIVGEWDTGLPAGLWVGILYFSAPWCGWFGRRTGMRLRCGGWIVAEGKGVRYRNV